MKKLIAALLLCLLPSLAQATSCPSYPFTLQNNTTADATQVMANFNVVRNCVINNTANNGVNTDITQLVGLTTPLAAGFGGSSVYVGGISAGTATAQTLSAPVPTGFALTAGNQVNFIIGVSNSGALTLNVNSTGATNVFKSSPTGPIALTGGEMVAGNTAVVIYDGTQFILLTVDPSSAIPVGTSLNFRGMTVPAGFLAEGGQAVSRTTYAALFAVMTFTSAAVTTAGSKIITGISSTATLGVGMPVGGSNITCGDTIASVDSPTQVTLLTNNAGSSGATTLTFAPHGVGNCSTTFNVPDSRGRLDAGNDNPVGGLGTAGRITVAGSNCRGTVLGTGCGLQTHTQTVAEVPTITPAGTIANTSGGVSAISPASSSGATQVSAAVGVNVFVTGTFASIDSVFTGTPFGGGAAMPILNPVMVTNRMIKF